MLLIAAGCVLRLVPDSLRSLEINAMNFFISLPSSKENIFILKVYKGGNCFLGGRGIKKHVLIIYNDDY